MSERRTHALDIGCGANTMPGALGMDVAASTGADIVGRVEALPLLENAVDIVYLSHILEHVDSLVGVMEGVWKICRDDARVHVWAPHFSCGLYTWADPTHRRSLASTVFDYFAPASAMSYYSNARFEVLRCELHFGLRRGAQPARGLNPSTIRLKSIVGGFLEPIANWGRVGQLLCERVWGPWIGFEEIYFELAAVKT